MQTSTTTFTNFSKHNNAAWCIGTPAGNVIADSFGNDTVAYIMPKHAGRVMLGEGLMV